jgi:hypothetical protein
MCCIADVWRSVTSCLVFMYCVAGMRYLEECQFSWLYCVILQITDIWSSVIKRVVCVVLQISGAVSWLPIADTGQHTSAGEGKTWCWPEWSSLACQLTWGQCVLDHMQVNTTECIWAKWGIDKLCKEQLYCLHWHNFIMVVKWGIWWTGYVAWIIVFWRRENTQWWSNGRSYS